MATVKFRLASNRKNQRVAIYVRFKHSNIFDAEAPTQLTVLESNWSSAKQTVKPSASSEDRETINTQLEALKAKIFSQYNIDNHAGILINSEWLKALINSFHNKPTSSENDKGIFLSSFGAYYSEKAKVKINMQTGEKLDERTFLDYQNTNNKLKDFEKSIGKMVRLTESDLNFHRDFITYLRTMELLGENTIGSMISNIKVFLRDADRHGYNVNKAYTSKDFYIPSTQTNDPYFSEPEIDLIKGHSFEIDGYLDNARDWLIIGVRTGLRISDFLKLQIEDYSDGFIENKNFKTGIPVIIPIHFDVQNILDKRNGQLPRKISEQNFNVYIKEVAKICGITNMINGAKMMKVKNGHNKEVHRKLSGIYPKFELVTSHICRRTFATHLYGKIDTLTIMKITGHKTEKQFLDYVKITPKEYAMRLKEHWAKTTK